jgi:regulator of protease activity HflC (stomatin/prohibitin superfamily)
MERRNAQMLNFNKGLYITIAVIVLILFVMGSCVTIIPTGYTGVRMSFGQIDPNPLPSDIHYKIPFVQTIHKVNNKQQDIAFPEKVWSVTAENTNVFMEDVVVTYQINGDKSAWIYANVSNYEKNLVSRTLLESALKASSVTLSTDQIPNRGLIEPIAKEKLQIALEEKYGDDVVDVIAVRIGNIDFEPAYNEALEQKQLAQKRLETAQIENKTVIEKAEAEAKAQLLKAQADADEKLVRAKAEAEAYELLTKKLTSPILLDKYIEKWDGVLPRISGDNSMIFDVSSILKEYGVQKEN